METFLLSTDSDELICFSQWPCEIRSIFNLRSQDRMALKKSVCKWQEWKLASRLPTPGPGSKPAFGIMALPSSGFISG